VVALFAAVPAVVLGAAGLVAGGPVVGAVLLVVVAVVLATWARFGGERRILAAIGGRDADPLTDARLWNLAEGLSIGAGLRQPRLRVIDSPGPNEPSSASRPGFSLSLTASNWKRSWPRS
jgi:Zn-dependent protease with chaperone function